ncbi:hypothetical protein L226DRAFT_91552 [Lentinus tigrinus ALCF2SS1-7]|uniref:uncharacterized protein n=1 Tax=Lentinus tigrinus ALCF2SS1-7 TaxID=1328758 RepID=UPI001165DCCA|nr:hypothetical protein L226DRAFT_91552 [Lentinus tigrinus ALCF2SS1-7]
MRSQMESDIRRHVSCPRPSGLGRRTLRRTRHEYLCVHSVLHPCTASRAAHPTLAARSPAISLAQIHTGTTRAASSSSVPVPPQSRRGPVSFARRPRPFTCHSVLVASPAAHCGSLKLPLTPEFLSEQTSAAHSAVPRHHLTYHPPTVATVLLLPSSATASGGRSLCALIQHTLHPYRPTVL